MNNESGTLTERIRQPRQREPDPAALGTSFAARGIGLTWTGLDRLETAESRKPKLMLIAAVAEIMNLSWGRTTGDCLAPTIEVSIARKAGAFRTGLCYRTLIE